MGLVFLTLFGPMRFRILYEDALSKVCVFEFLLSFPFKNCGRLHKTVLQLPVEFASKIYDLKCVEIFSKVLDCND